AAAALYAREGRSGKLTLEHVRRFHQELQKAGIREPVTSPLLIPDYLSAGHKARQHV
ncbi:MAG: hypothetical protein H5T99_11100, partial [Moorella sp. (in: Bacteria)]|nr:hypothetical protein [Moorella sp. (in: firmicutes)]